ncbi:MAG: hypothetical protein IKY94_15185 [Lachnospiraceae bacterium]|nr:hypothetical protein [Lachnospiraceae bacterium]
MDAALSDKYNELGEYISLLSKLSSKNASLQGLTDAGKGSGGGKALADLKEVTERYHEITREIQYQEEELDKLRTTIDRTYGLDKIKLYTKE